MEFVGAIDGGGTTFKCGIVTRDGQLMANRHLDANDPAKVLPACADFFREQAALGRPAATIGLACFGPLDIDPSSETYGCVMLTPKRNWSMVDLLGQLSRLTKLPIRFDTDVNGALLGERKWGAARGTQTATYVTVGTGIGAGLFASGNVIGRPTHPEFGHIPVERHPEDSYPGCCSFHGACLEGMASATAIAGRFGPTESMSPAHPGWNMAAFYLAQACQSLYLTLRPEKIILGGGLMLADGLIARVRTAFTARLNHYTGMSAEDAEHLIVLPELGENAGLLGAACLALSGLDSVP